MRPYYQLISYRILRRTFRNIRVRLPARTVVVPSRDPNCLSSLFWKYSWKTQVIGWTLAQRPGSFLDIGANVGQTLFDFLATGAPTNYVGFEPNVRCAAYLSRLMHKNALANATLVPVALGEAASLLQLRSFSSSETDSAAYIHAFVRPDWETRCEHIPCMRFDDIAPTLGIDQIGLCKIDVEGFELEVLGGMTKALAVHRPPILCEVLDADINADLELNRERTVKLRERLTEFGYRIFRVVKTADDLFADLVEISELPNRRWEKEAEDQCDYLFAHREDSLPAELRSRIKIS